ncbi:hypothetical protein ABZ345_17970 [Lentzea sp. NPDC005914]|uniref:hypothetical protein n=1 Tax=Lentzea sp. NPDC005914 TaxID=3154572 RepID=UPI0033DC018E
MASSGRFTWNVVRFSVLTAVAALGLVAGIGLIQTMATNAVHTRATVEVEGKVVDGYRPPDEKALVVWDDQEGHEQTTWFELDEPDHWAPGRPFRLRYDPDEGNPKERGPYLPALDREKVVSAEAGARNAEEATGWENWWPTTVIGAVVFLVLLAWATRGWLNRSAAAGRSEPVQVVVVRGHSDNLGAKKSMALLLAPPETPLDPEALAELPDVPRVVPGAQWQRVYWHPALERLTPGQTVTARLKDGLGARAVVEPEPHVRIWPAGRLRAKSRWGIVYTMQHPRPHPRWANSPHPPLAVWLVPIPAGVLGAARGHFLADAPLIILGLLVITTFLWAWYTPAPAEN